MSWWLYVLGAVVVVLLAIAYIMYRGYSRVKPKPLPGIPCPPFTHQILGHPERMIHPLKHELRLEVCEAYRDPFHQLIILNANAVFINDADEAGRVAQEVTKKGRIYADFRYTKNVPDMLACDGEAFETRRQLLTPGFLSLSLSSESKLFDHFKQALQQKCDSNENVDAQRLITLFALDCICEAAFGYELGALLGSDTGERLVSALTTFYDAQAATGLFPRSDARKVTPAELSEAGSTWRGFLTAIVNHLPTTKTSLAENLIELRGKEGEEAVISEVHQIVRHGHECLAGMLLWLTYALSRKKQVRSSLEKALMDYDPASSAYPDYVEWVVLEALRRYPVTGNFTVRTPHETGFMLSEAVEIPVGVPLHLHMFSLHNTEREWLKPKEFIPERWQHPSADGKSSASARELSFPSCPFLKARGGSVYDGAGFRENALSYFPFGVSPRVCPSRSFAVHILQTFLVEICSSFRLDPSEEQWQEDVGGSAHSVIVPLSKKSTIFRVRKIASLSDLVNGNNDVSDVKVEQEEGWADESEDINTQESM